MSPAHKPRKTTVLDGYYATGDYECFCFDKHKTPGEHHQVTESIEDPTRWDDCRVYPDDLIPKGLNGKKGKWTVTVEFEETKMLDPVIETMKKSKWKPSQPR